VGGVVTSFDEAVSWEIDPADVRVRLSDRLAARLPEMSRLAWGRMKNEPAGSRMRGWMLCRLHKAAWAAMDRRDYGYVENFYDPEVEVIWGDQAFIDVDTHTHGWDALRKGFETIYETIDSMQTPLEVIDFGGPFHAARISNDLIGPGSGISLQAQMFCLDEQRDPGRVVRQWASSERKQIEAWLAERVAALG
jgi:hypothetical protein